MSAPVLPKTLFVYLLSDGFGPRFSVHETRDESEGHRPQGQLDDCSSVTEYVLASELTHLRAALAEIAALQTEAPADTSEETGERFDSLRDAYECGEMDGYRDGQWEASEVARKALVSK